MKKHLNIDLNNLPEEGKAFSGDLDASIFKLSGEDAHATGPLFYDLFVQKFDNEVLVRGNLSVPIQFTCVRSLTPFIQTISVENCALCIEGSGGQIDLADALREEIIILYPDYPHCDEADEPMECNLDSSYLAVDKPTNDDVKTPLSDEAPTPWDALNALEDNS